MIRKLFITVLTLTAISSTSSFAYRDGNKGGDRVLNGGSQNQYCFTSIEHDDFGFYNVCRFNEYSGQINECSKVSSALIDISAMEECIDEL